MMISGYPEEFRAGVIQSAVIGYQRLAAACERGERPLCRLRVWQQETRRRMKKLKKAAWHRPADSVLFVPATPNAELAGVSKRSWRRRRLVLGWTSEWWRPGDSH